MRVSGLFCVLFGGVFPYFFPLQVQNVLDIGFHAGGAGLFLWLAAGASVVLSYCVKGPSVPFLLDIRRGIVGGGGVSRFGGRLAHPAGGFRRDFCRYLRNFYIFLGKAL